MLKKLTLVAMVGLLLLSLVACSSNGESPDDVVAIVNSKEILRGDFDKELDNIKMTYLQYGIDIDSKEHAEMRALVEEEVIYNLIQEELLLQKALEKNYEYTKEDALQEVEQFKAEFENEEEFFQILEANNLTVEELEKLIFNDHIITLYVQEEIGELTVSEEELLAIYEEYSLFIEDMPEFDEVRFQLEEEVKYEKYMAGLEDLLFRIMEESEIEILL